ncbi:MAG TPA: HipA domain-containing protein [Opitutus sp.]|nr:HipA domain-containing protein [Opitutus sp.]
MADPFPILSLQADSPELIEQLGSKPKFWFRMTDDEQPWLFKFARERTGEHWAEKIAAEVAVLIGVPAARVELAEFGNKCGSASRSFVRQESGFDLVHGDELLAGHVIGYDRSKVFRQSSHSISNIVKVMETVFTDVETRDVQLTRFAGFMVLDALIGNTDRHHQNWGILRRTLANGAIELELAPSFDHASSLGRNIPIDERERRLKECTVLGYAKKGRGGIYWSASDKKGANPLDLAMRAAHNWPGYFRPWLLRLQQVADQEFSAIVDRIPPEWMDAVQKEFCVSLLFSTSSELKKLPL